MRNEILWLLDNETDDRAFERLATALMYRWGYRHIKPLGGNYDGGRDAEMTIYDGRGRAGGRVFFQYTLADKWEAKLRLDLAKVRSNGHNIKSFVFVTRKHVTGVKQDALKEEIRKSYGWTFEIFHREWLRHQLDDAYPKLAERYLGAEPRPVLTAAPIAAPEEYESAPTVRELLLTKAYEAAIPALRTLLKRAPLDWRVWTTLASCYYEERNYGEALACANEATRLRPKSKRAHAVKASILAEHGRELGNRPMLILARDIFASLLAYASDYSTHYNYGNVLSALHDYQGAREAYLEAVNFDDRVPEIWKNLGTAHGALGDREQELKCYERALELNPDLVNGLISKANTIAEYFGRYAEAVALFDRAFALEPRLARMWPHAHWWKASYLMKLKRREDALAVVDSGLEASPGYEKLLDLKAFIMAGRWRGDRKEAPAAERFFRSRIEIYPNEIASLVELAELARARGHEAEALESVSRALQAVGNPSGRLAPDVLLSLASLDQLLAFFGAAAEYAEFRRVCPIDKALAEFPPRSKRPGAEFLWLAFGMAYVRARKVAAAALKAPTRGATKKIFESSRLATCEALLRVARLSARLQARAPREYKLHMLSEILYCYPLIHAHEWSSVSGYLTGFSQVPRKTFLAVREEVIKTMHGEGGRLNVKDMLVVVNDEWKVFPNKSTTRAEKRRSSAAAIARPPRLKKTSDDVRRSRRRSRRDR